MGDSLQDQLRSLGLAKNKPAAKKRKQQSSRKAERPARGKETKPAGELSLDQAYALRQREERKQAQRARQKKQEEERRRRQVNKAIREIVVAQRQNIEDADVPRNFMFNGRIRKIYVSAEQQRALSAGELGVVYLSGSYHLLAPAALASVREISNEHVVDLGLEADDDDAGYPVPDDLTW